MSRGKECPLQDPLEACDPRNKRREQDSARTEDAMGLGQALPDLSLLGQMIQRAEEQDCIEEIVLITREVQGIHNLYASNVFLISS